MIIHNVRGAEGGVEAITARRRNSGSFKHMSTTGLVSSSPFVQRLGSNQGSPTKPPVRPQSLYEGGSRIPQAVGGRKTSGLGGRKPSAEHVEGPVKENSNPELASLAQGGGGKSEKDEFLGSPLSSQPFKPSRPVSTSALPSPSLSAPSSPFKPTRPQFARRQPSADADEPARRQSSSYAALRKNGLVSHSPFTSSSASSSAPSPELPQAPYEIAALATEEAPRGVYEQGGSPDLSLKPAFEPAPTGSSASTKTSGQAGLGARPGGGAPERRVYASPEPLPQSPPSALSPGRRGIRGPRPLDGSFDDGDETEREDAALSSRTLRRQPSNKTVTWAETEEVLEFEVEEERRRSMMSDASSTFSSDDGDHGRYGSEDEEEDSEDDGYRAYHPQQHAQQQHYQHQFGGPHAGARYSFEEGGSVEVHDLSGDYSYSSTYDHDAGSDAEDSVVSTGSSAMDDMIGQIDSYIHEGGSYEVVTADIFSPSQIPSFSDSPDLPSHHSSPRPQDAAAPSPRAPQSAFSVSTVSGSSAAGGEQEVGSEVSVSAYDDDDQDDRQQQTREQLLARARASLPPPPAAAPSSPRPPLPSPPSLAPAIAPTAATAHLGPALGMSKSESQYSLPDIVGTSPFLGFEDDGAASSVATAPLDAPVKDKHDQEQHEEDQIPTTLPLSPRSPPVSSSGAFSSLSAGDSPIMSALSRAPTTLSPSSPALSRKASLVGSDVGSQVSTATSSISWYGSTANGSLRGGTVRLGRDRLEERMKAHQALFASPGPSAADGNPAASFGSFPATSTPPPAATNSSAAATTGAASAGPFSAAMEGITSAPSAPLTGSQIIAARPAPKARSATLSSSMLPTIAASPQRAGMRVHVGDPLTREVAEEMRSPLERLQRGVEGKDLQRESGVWRSGDSLLGVNELAEGEEDEGEVTEREDEVSAGSGPMQRNGSGNALRDREQAIIAKRREKAGLAPPSAAGKGKGRRRSRSTGDADVAETVSVPMEYHHTMPELGFERRAADSAGGGGAFANGVLESLDDIYNSRNRTYRVRESKRIVVVSDLAAGSKAGDVDPGRAWRKKRPSDVHAINRSLSTMSIGSQQARRTRELSGQLFVHLRDVTFDNVPMPRSQVRVTASLDNGRQRVDAAVRDMSQKISLKKEFELVCTESLAFSIHFSVPPAPVVAAPAPTPSPAPTPPASPSKSHRGFRIFSSPKKRSATPTRAPTPVAAPPPTPDPFYDYVSSDGQLATARITFSSEAANCRLKKSRFQVPFGQKAERSARSCSGSLTVELLFVPAMSGVPKAQLPKSMDEVAEGLELADWAGKITHESVLTQLGGDCSIWRRRVVKLRGSTLVPYSEVTKRSHVEINLALVASIADLNTPSMPTPGSRASRFDEDEDVGRMENSFRLVFKDGNSIDFFADDAEAKAKWIEVLNQVIGKAENKKTPPEWAVAARKLPPPKSAA
ncbi:hypothetical protein JCM10213_005229 [Rhodosporidiobolus nylandii]